LPYPALLITTSSEPKAPIAAFTALAAADSSVTSSAKSSIWSPWRSDRSCSATLSTDRLIGNKIQLYTQKTGVPVYRVLPLFVAELLSSLPRISDRYFFWTGKSSLHTVNGVWQRTLHALFRAAGIKQGYAHRLRDTFSVSLLLAGVPIERVSILLGHSNIKVTQQHYNPWVRDRQVQLEADLQRAWNRDPLVLLNSNAGNTEVPQLILPN
jgi:hypothetical protein